MKLLEYEAKKLCEKHSILVPRHVMVRHLEDLKHVPFDKCVVKAQVLYGNRKKKGLIKVTTKERLKHVCMKLIKTYPLMISEFIDAKTELYIALTLDYSKKNIVLLFSRKGGTGIEQRKSVQSFHITTTKNLKDKLKKFNISGLEIVGANMMRLMKEHDATLVEINPLAVRGKKLIALDTKIVIDDNALYRHQDFLKLKRREYTVQEYNARNKGLHLVELEGTIGVIGDGAGITMALLDELSRKGKKPAFFMDIGGGADKKRMIDALRLINTKKVKKLYINIFGGITDCVDIAKAIIAYKKKLLFPFIVRMKGTNDEEAQKLLKKNSVLVVDTISEAITYVCS